MSVTAAEAEPLVLLPGMGCSARLWARVTPALPVSAVTPMLDADRLNDCVTALLDVLPTRFALAGLSLGGIVAMAMVRRDPSRVTRLCLMSTNPYAPSPAQRDGWAHQLSALASGRTPRELQTDLLPLLVRPDVADALAEEVLEMATDVGASRLARQLWLQGTRVDEREGLTRIHVPTLIIAAADDALCPVTRHQEMAALIPSSRLVILPETGHLSPMERPELVAAELQQWLAGPAIA